MFDIKNLKNEYYNRRHGGEIGADFIEPCLSVCKYYRRNLGSFSSAGLKWYISSIENYIKNDVKIRIMCSPNIDHITQKVLIDMDSEEKRNEYIHNEIVDKQLLAACGIKKNEGGLAYGWQEKFLCYLIANNILEIRMAVPLAHITPKERLSDKYIDKDNWKKDSYINSKKENSDQLLLSALFHVKLGYFDFGDGKEISFNGSANESKNAYEDSVESIDVNLGWKSDFEKNKIASHKKALDEDWNCTTREDEKNLGFRTFEMGKEAFALFKRNSPSTRPVRTKISTPVEEDDDDTNKEAPFDKYSYQDEAVDKFLTEKKGILKMCTGSGKTRVALKIIDALIESKKIDKFIITCAGVALLKQWQDIFDNMEDEATNIYSNGFIHYKNKKERLRFMMNPKNWGLLTSIDDVHNAINDMDADTLKRTIVVYDEVHDLGAESRLPKIKNKICELGYLLGLSATPYAKEEEELENIKTFIKKKNTSKLSRDEEIKKIFGQKPIYEFPLEEAIKRGILCEFNYTPLDYELTKEESDEVNRLRGIIFALQEDSKDFSTQAYMLARIYKTSESKILPFQKIIKVNQKLWRSTIIFTETYEYASKVAEILQEIPSINYKVLHDNKTSVYLNYFIEGRLDVLVTCKKISQGIDIPKLENIILLSVAKAERDYIQKIGRVLRNPGGKHKKIAEIVDFVEYKMNNEDSYDNTRLNFLDELSKLKLEE